MYPERPLPSVLDDAVGESLSHIHAPFAIRRNRIVGYRPDVSPFAAMPETPTGADWDDLRRLAVDRPVVLMDAPAGIEHVATSQTVGLQMVAGPHLAGRRHSPSTPGGFEIVRLGPRDSDEMVALAQRTQPGPFAPRTVELGTYLGARCDGALVAMAGERLRPRGWSEISGVCTDESFRGQGLARRLMTLVADAATDRGDVPFLHVAGSNTDAIRLYESMGFVRRRAAVLSVVAKSSEG